MGGFRMEAIFLGEPLKVNQVLELSIKNTEENLESIEAIGQIVWMKQQKKGYAFEIGVMLTYAREEDKQRFIACLTRTSGVKNKIDSK